MIGDFAAVGVKNGRRHAGAAAAGPAGPRHRRVQPQLLHRLRLEGDLQGAALRAHVLAADLLASTTCRRCACGWAAADAKKAVRGIIRALSKIIRDSDVIAKASDQEFYLLLPETDFFGAMMFVRRAMAAVRDEPEVQEVEAKLPLALVGGASTFPKDGEDFDELVHRCRRRMDERRASLQRRLMLDGLPFWDEVELLLGQRRNSPKLPSDERAEPSRRGKVSDVLFDELQAEIARELLQRPGLARAALRGRAGDPARTCRSPRGWRRRRRSWRRGSTCWGGGWTWSRTRR